MNEVQIAPDPDAKMTNDTCHLPDPGVLTTHLIVMLSMSTAPLTHDGPTLNHVPDVDVFVSENEKHASE